MAESLEKPPDKPKQKQPKRKIASKGMLDKKIKETLVINHKILSDLIGSADIKGCWLIYGTEKNGKTTLSLQLAKALATNNRVDFISAEEGLEYSFQQACKRSGITPTCKVRWSEYLTLDALMEHYKKPRTAKIIIIDNLTIYADEFKVIKFSKLLEALKNKLIIFIAHEERKEPYPAVARMAKKLSKVYFHVQGLKGTVVSRFGGGGDFLIDKDKATLYWGDTDLKQI